MKLSWCRSIRSGVRIYKNQRKAICLLNAFVMSHLASCDLTVCSLPTMGCRQAVRPREREGYGKNLETSII